jgi:L-iditol 2-dehydrogenase
VQGAGPLGLYAAAMAMRAGAHQVVVIGAPANRLAVAQAWGASHTINIEETPDARERRGIVRDLTGRRGADVVIEVSGGATAFPEGIDLVRRGGRYLVVGQVGEHQVAIAPRYIVEKQISIIGVMSGDTHHYYKALQFIHHNRERFGFEDMLSNRYTLDQVNDAMESMRTFREVKAVLTMA